MVPDLDQVLSGNITHENELQARSEFVQGFPYKCEFDLVRTIHTGKDKVSYKERKGRKCHPCYNVNGISGQKKGQQKSQSMTGFFVYVRWLFQT